ncbi:unnamed protein product, partial [Brassica oleracea var. botrytis]
SFSSLSLYLSNQKKKKKGESDMASPSKRREMDMMKLMMSDYKVDTVNDDLHMFYVTFHGPTDSLYEGGVWKIKVELPEAYPYKSPSVGFVNKIYHPNVDESSGAVCLDVINQTWSPMFDLINVFESFLPQLLLYPNPSDPFNGEAASLLMRDRPAYELKVKGSSRSLFLPTCFSILFNLSLTHWLVSLTFQEYCKRYAKPEDIGAPEEISSDDDDDDSMSERGSDSDDNDEIAGKADP